VTNSFLDQFAPNIKFDYFCFDRVIIRGYIRHLFFAGGVAILLKVLGFRQMTTGVMRILTDQLNAHIEKVAKQKDIPIHWCLPALLKAVPFSLLQLPVIICESSLYVLPSISSLQVFFT
jgi:hypothetical protein